MSRSKKAAIRTAVGLDESPRHAGAFLAACALEGACSDLPEVISDEPKPAPVVSGERYACWAGVCMWLTDGEDDPRDTGTRAEAEARAAGIPGAKVVRILNDGEHEAAVAKAREEGAEAVRADFVQWAKRQIEMLMPCVATSPVHKAQASVFDGVIIRAKKGCAK